MVYWADCGEVWGVWWGCGDFSVGRDHAGGLSAREVGGEEVYGTVEVDFVRTGSSFHWISCKNIYIYYCLKLQRLSSIFLLPSTSPKVGKL